MKTNNPSNPDIPQQIYATNNNLFWKLRNCGFPGPTQCDTGKEAIINAWHIKYIPDGDYTDPCLLCRAQQLCDFIPCNNHYIIQVQPIQKK